MRSFCPSCNATLEDATVRHCPTCNRTPPRRFGWPKDRLLGEVVDGGKFTIERRIGAGGFAVVYLVSPSDSVHKMAMKVLGSRFARNKDVRERFGQEISALRQLQHPNIVSCHSAGTLETKQPYIVLDLIKGASLRELLDAEADQPRRPLPPARAVGIAIQIASALAEAHRQNVLHRDLNPNNILLTPRPDGTDAVQIIDFGVAKILGKNTLDQITHRIVGTPEFMAPEQFNPGERLDPRLDLWQLGATFYFMLTGEPPYTSPRSPVDLLRNQLQMAQREHEHGPKPGDARPLLRHIPDLDALTSELLSTKPDMRPDSAKKVKARLEQILEHTDTQHTPQRLNPPMPAAGPWFCPNCQASIAAPEEAGCDNCNTARSPAGWPGDPLIGKTVGGDRCVVLSRLHAGRFGVIYHVFDREVGAQRALKHVSSYGRLAEVQHLFHKAMSRLCDLEHPNIIRYYEVGLLPETTWPFLLMEYLPDPPLSTSIWPSGAGFPILQDPLDVVRIGLQIASALEYLHAQDLYHHNLSPQTVVLTIDDATPRPRLIGLSNAQILDATAPAQTLDIYHNPEYLAPEQFDWDIPFGAAIDIYQLGAVLHFLLTGWPPYPGDPLDPRKPANSYQIAQTQIVHRHTLGPRPSAHIPALRLWNALDELVAQMLSTSAELRPNSMTDVSSQLAAVLGTIPAANFETIDAAPLDLISDTMVEPPTTVDFPHEPRS